MASMSILTTVVFGLALAQLLALPGLALAQTQPLFDVLNAQSDLASFRAALSLVPDLAITLAGAGNITILAPTDAAFVALALSPNTTEAQVVDARDPAGVAALLAYHVLNASYPSSAVTVVPTYVPTFLDDRYRILGAVRTTVTGGQNVGAFLNGSDVTFLSGDLSSVAVTEADIKVPGDANITIHKIGGFLRIPANISTTLPELGTTNGAAGAFRDLAESGQLGAGSDTLDLLPDVTLFVPNDKAFQAAGSALLGTAGAAVDAALLQGVLRYHVANGTVMFASEAADGTVATLDGGGAELTLSVVDGVWFVDTARVLVPNIIVAGGVAHIIDTVLNPNATDPDRASLNPTASPTAAFSSASLVAETPFATGVTATTTLSIPAVLTTGAVITATAGAAAAETTPASGAAVPAAPGADLGRRVAAVQVGALLMGVLLR